MRIELAQDTLKKAIRFYLRKQGILGEIDDIEFKVTRNPTTAMAIVNVGVPDVNEEHEPSAIETNSRIQRDPDAVALDPESASEEQAGEEPDRLFGG